MHFIAQLCSSQKEYLRTQTNIIKLRGYSPKTWVAPELINIKLPVNAIAYNICPTYRDLYLERINRIRSELTWNRYMGKIIDATYKIVHNKCKWYVLNRRRSRYNLLNYVARKQKAIIHSAKELYEAELRNVNPPVNQNQIRSLDLILKKIIKSEANTANSIINFELSRVAGANIKGIFDEYLSFNTNLILKSPHMGFSEKATPDFVYKHEIIGDIKTGKWQEFYMYTAAAYALAYEEHTGRNMNYGVILHVEFPRSKDIPVYSHTSIEFIDDPIRNKFLAIRDRKLQIIKEKEDPGKPDSQDKCDPSCSFLQKCWRENI